MEEKIISILEKIGFNKNEIKTYIDLIKHKKSTALEIAKRTQIHRSNTYDILRKLLDKGFVKEILEDKRKLYTATDPEKIKFYLKQQMQEFDSLIPYLKGLMTDEDNVENISLIKGLFAIRETLYDLLKLKKTINVYGASQMSVNYLGEGFLKEFHAARIKENIIMRHIYDETVIERVKHLNKLKYTEAKYLPKKYQAVAATIICGNVVFIIVFSSPLSGILIKNKEISETYQIYFELLYRDAKKV